MKRRKWLIPVFIIAAIVLFNVVVYFANNMVAKGLEKRLLDYPLPPDTDMIESCSIAGKLYGNGNGMQYYGIMLIKSELPIEDIIAHYNDDSQDTYPVFVTKQESPVIFDGYDYVFEKFPDDANCYMLKLYSDSVIGCEGTLWEGILNSDLRGH